MEITDFKDRHIEEAASISFEAWGEEFSGRGPDPGFARFVYLSMVVFYDRDRNYSFVALKDGRLKGFLPGFPSGTRAEKETAKERLSAEEKTLLENYTEYLEKNGLARAKHAGANSAVIGLIASGEKGAGRRLAERFEEKCAGSGMSDVILWADVTCGYGFHEKTGYETAEIFDRTDSDGRPFKTRIFRKRLSPR